MNNFRFTYHKIFIVISYQIDALAHHNPLQTSLSVFNILMLAILLFRIPTVGSNKFGEKSQVFLFVFSHKIQLLQSTNGENVQ